MVKPAYLAMCELAMGRPTIVFVPSRKQCKLTANDILTYCMADENEKRFLNIEENELQPHLDLVQDKDLVETLKYGIGFFHEALSKADKRIVSTLFKAGAIKTLIASKVSCRRCRVNNGLPLILTLGRRTPLGACQSLLTWSLSWAYSLTRGENIAMWITPSPTFSR